MAYSNQSITKVIKLMKVRKHYIEQIGEVKMCISGGNRKIGRVMNVSLPPILTCSNCSECKHFCYDIKACLQYPGTVIDARIRNLVILERNMNTYFTLIDQAISRRRKNKFFRWHVAGDIVNYEYFCNMVEIAKRHPDFTFWTYTKNYEIVNEYVFKNSNGFRSDAIPENFHIMFSEWDGMPMENPYDFPVFSCKLKAGNKNHPVEYFDGLYKCPGNCDLCKAGKLGCIGGMDTYADEH